MKTKYAIKVMIAKDDWIYVTVQGETDPWDVSPLLFNSRKVAEEHARIWGNKNVAQVVRWRKKCEKK